MGSHSRTWTSGICWSRDASFCKRGRFLIPSRPWISELMPLSIPIQNYRQQSPLKCLQTQCSRLFCLSFFCCGWEFVHGPTAQRLKNYEDAFNMDEKLSRYLNSIPVWSPFVANCASSQQMSRIRVAVEPTLRQYLIILHTPFVSLMQQILKYVHSRCVHFEATMAILCQFQDIIWHPVSY